MRPYITLCLIALFLGIPLLGQAAEQPNIIFIMVDDLGPEWISCYGAEDINTPSIDALADTGMKFDVAYSMPKCTPTRATLLTGQYPFRHGWMNHWDVPRWGHGMNFDAKHNTSFARLLKDGGYKTAIAGKWQINDFRVEPNVLKDHGFDAWCMWTGYETGNAPSAKRYWDAYIHTNEGSEIRKDAFGPEVYTDFIIDFMKENKDEPMLIYYPMVLTHSPLVNTPLEPKAMTNQARFKSMVEYTDHNVGRIVTALDELEIREDTILIFTTDNGTSPGIKGTLNGREVKGGKGLLSERGCRVPFIVNGPGQVPAGVTSPCLTDFTDMLPTFCELAGVELPEDLELDGHSIAPVIRGERKLGKRDWIMAMGGDVARLDEEGRVVPALPYAPRTVRDQRYKLIVDENAIPTALYQLVVDPGEENNLLQSKDKNDKEALKRLTRIVAEFPEQDALPRYDRNPAQEWDTDPVKK